MEASVSVRVEFDAAHQMTSAETADRVRCVRVHGHRWSATAESLGREEELEAHLSALVSEWRDALVNEMLPGVDPSPENLARVIMERLLLRHPRLVLVSVSDGTLTGIVRNTPR